MVRVVEEVGMLFLFLENEVEAVPTDADASASTTGATFGQAVDSTSGASIS